jgi:hypothetical protein
MSRSSLSDNGGGVCGSSFGQSTQRASHSYIPHVSGQHRSIATIGEREILGGRLARNEGWGGPFEEDANDEDEDNARRTLSWSMREGVDRRTVPSWFLVRGWPRHL